MILVWWLSSRTTLDDAGTVPIPGGWFGNFLHFVTFAGLATLWATAADPAARFGGSSRKSKVVAFTVCVLYGLTDETHQYFSPGRCCSVYDLVIDVCGTLCALNARFGLLPDVRAMVLRSRVSTGLFFAGLFLSVVSGGNRPPGDLGLEALLAAVFAAK